MTRHQTAAGPARSFWLEKALAGETDQPVLEGRLKCDVCVVGGGYTGLWTALRLKERDSSLRVVLVERDVCGAGASGQNSGFVLSWWCKFPSLVTAVGSEEAVRLCLATESCVAGIGEFCAEHNLDVGYKSGRWLWTATNPAQVGAWRPIVEAIAAAGGGEPFVEVSKEEAMKHVSSPRPLGGVYERSALVQPALLARGLRRVAIDRGVELFEHSEVQAYAPRVKTARGEIEADTVVVATGAWLGHNNRTLTVISSDVLATERLSQMPLDADVWCSDSRLMVHACREYDGRLIFSKGGAGVAFAGRADTFSGVCSRAETAMREFRQFYPQLRQVRIERSWGGPIDRTTSGVPFFYRDGNVVYGAGYSGVGLCQAAVGGRILASLALRGDDEWARCGLARRPLGAFPPEPIRYLGARSVRAAVARKEQAEDDGRSAGAVTLRLASLAPPGFVPGAATHSASSRPTGANGAAQRTRTVWAGRRAGLLGVAAGCVALAVARLHGRLVDARARKPRDYR
jgi:glycine/D-amino acid oxidase-like deaminating enzyme